MGFLGFPVGVAISVAYRFFAPIPEVRGSEWFGFLTFASTAVLGLAAGLLALCRLRSSGPKWAPWAAGIGVVLNLLAAVFAAFALRRLLHS